MANAYNTAQSIALNGATYDFAEASGRFYFVLGGHAHSDISYAHNDVTVVGTVNATANTSSPSFDLVLIDYGANKIRMTRVGKGESRVVSLSGEDVVSYTNLADPTSSDWLNNKGISGSTGEVVGDSGTGNLVTNYIPIALDSKIHIKGFETGVGTPAQFSLVFYKADKSYNTNYGKVYYPGMTSAEQLTLAEYDKSVFIVDMAKISGLNGVAYIRVSGIPSGSVDDIIITIDEPIM